MTEKNLFYTVIPASTFNSDVGKTFKHFLMDFQASDIIATLTDAFSATMVKWNEERGRENNIYKAVRSLFKIFTGKCARKLTVCQIHIFSKPPDSQQFNHGWKTKWR